jgi:ureidoglycolate lyase
VLRIRVEPLTRDAFVRFGDVIETEGSSRHTINQGHAERYHDLARLDLTADGGHPLLNIFRASPWPNPIRIETMERHPVSSQAFVPLTATPFLVVVAAPTERLLPEDLRAFVTNGRQGVNYHRGVWHHALLALAPADFLVVDRGGPGVNCDEVQFEQPDIFLDRTASSG